MLIMPSIMTYFFSFAALAENSLVTAGVQLSGGGGWWADGVERAVATRLAVERN